MESPSRGGRKTKKEDPASVLSISSIKREKTSSSSKRGKREGWNEVKQRGKKGKETAPYPYRGEGELFNSPLKEMKGGKRGLNLKRRKGKALGLTIEPQKRHLYSYLSQKEKGKEKKRTGRVRGKRKGKKRSFLQSLRRAKKKKNPPVSF